MGMMMRSNVTFMVAVIISMGVMKLCVGDTSFLYAKCNEKCIPGGSPMWGNLGFILHQLAENTPYVDGFHMKTQYGGGSGAAFGEASCEASASCEECQHCLSYLSNQIWSTCSDAIGAQVQLATCCIRYEAYPF